VSVVAPGVVPNAGGTAYDRSSGTVWIVDEANQASLWKFQFGSGLTQIGTFPPPCDTTNGVGLAFSEATGRIFMVINDPLASQSQLYQINISPTLSKTPLGSPLPAGIEGLEWTMGVPGLDDLGTPQCLGDLDGDGAVGIGDLLDLLKFWGGCPKGCTDCCEAGCCQDFNGDDTVGFIDLLLLLARWGPCPGEK
jgi:hypothetical protein